jgi:hypothetical protein
LVQISYSVDAFPAPLKQLANGTPLQDLSCNLNLKLIFKTYDNSPACVTYDTAEALIKRQTHTVEISDSAVHSLSKKYRVLSWHDVSLEQKEYIVRMLWIGPDSDPVEIAKKSNEKPDGYAAIFLWKFATELYSNSNDRCINPNTGEYTQFQCPWLDNGVVHVKQKIIDWFSKYKEAGGNLDYLILDDEFSFSNWSLQTKSGWAKAIETDPRFTTLVPKLNYTSLDLVMDRPNANHPFYLQWNAVQNKMLVDARNTSIFEPIQELFPDLKASNYNDYVVTKENVLPEKNGHMQHFYSNLGKHNEN